VRTHSPTEAGVAACSGAPREVCSQHNCQGTRTDFHYVQLLKVVCLREFSKNPHGSTQYPLFRATVLTICLSVSASRTLKFLKFGLSTLGRHESQNYLSIERVALKWTNFE